MKTILFILAYIQFGFPTLSPADTSNQYQTAKTKVCVTNKTGFDLCILPNGKSPAHVAKQRIRCIQQDNNTSLTI